MGHIRYLALQLLIILMILGCSGGNNPTIPVPVSAPPADSAANAEREANGVTACVELMQVSINKNTGAVEIFPLRGAQLALNVLSLLEPPAGKYLKIDWNTLVIDQANLYVGVDVILTHPINLPFFRGFDVRGIVFGPDVTNADGYTTFLNPGDFTGVPYGYQNGLLGTPDEIAQFETGGNLWGYKYFCDCLGLKESLPEFFADPVNIANRGTFSPGAVNRRHYNLQFSPGPGDFLVFNYAVLASFHAPSGQKPWDIDDFEITSCNAAEAFMCSVNVLENTLFYREEDAKGGSFRFDLYLGDWQGFSDYDVWGRILGFGLVITFNATPLEPSGLPHIGVYHSPLIKPDPNSPDDLEVLIKATDLTTTFGQSWFQGLLPKDNPRYNDHVYTCWKSAVTVSDDIIFNPIDIAPDYFKPLRPEDIFVKDGVAYIAAEDRGLITLDVSDPSNPLWLGRSDAPMAASALWVSGNYAYAIGSNEDGLAVFDVTDPSHPHVVGFSQNTKYGGGDITVQGNYAYIGKSGFQGYFTIADISDPTSPTMIASLDLDQTDAVCVDGDLAYVTGDGKFNIIDISDPANPVIVGSVMVGGPHHALDVVGEFAYAVSGHTLSVIDISDPNAPFIRGEAEIKDNPLDDIKVSNGYAYIVCNNHGGPNDFGLYVVDVSNPDAPEVAAKRSIPNVAGNVFLDGHTAFLTYMRSGLYCIDISNPLQTELLGTYLTPGDAWDVDFCGNTLVVANGKSGLILVDVDSPANPQIAGFFDGQDEYRCLDVSSDYVYAPGWFGPLVILDSSDPTIPILCGTCDIQGPGRWITVDKGFAYITHGYPYAMSLINVSDPYSPFWIGEYFEDMNQVVRMVAIEDDIAYINTHYAPAHSIMIYDVSNPGEFNLLGSYDPEIQADDFKIVDGILYLCGGLSYTPTNFEVVDVGNPYSPALLGKLQFSEDGASVDVKYDYAFVTNSDLNIIKVSDPASPSFVGSWLSLGGSNIIVRQNIAYIADGTHGVRIIQLW